MIGATRHAEEPTMQSIAAYYVLVATDLSNEPRRHAAVVVVRRPSLVARFAARLGSLVGSGHSTAAQPA